MEKRDLEMKLDSCHPSTALLRPTFLPSQLQEPAILSLCFASGGVTQSPADGQQRPGSIQPPAELPAEFLEVFPTLIIIERSFLT